MKPRGIRLVSFRHLTEVEKRIIRNEKLRQKELLEEALRIVAEERGMRYEPE